MADPASAPLAARSPASGDLCCAMASDSDSLQWPPQGENTESHDFSSATSDTESTLNSFQQLAEAMKQCIRQPVPESDEAAAVYPNSVPRSDARLDLPPAWHSALRGGRAGQRLQHNSGIRRACIATPIAATLPHDSPMSSTMEVGTSPTDTSNSTEAHDQVHPGPHIFKLLGLDLQQSGPQAVSADEVTGMPAASKPAVHQPTPAMVLHSQPTTGNARAGNSTPGDELKLFEEMSSSTPSNVSLNSVASQKDCPVHTPIDCSDSSSPPSTHQHPEVSDTGKKRKMNNASSNESNPLKVVDEQSMSDSPPCSCSRCDPDDGRWVYPETEPFWVSFIFSHFRCGCCRGVQNPPSSQQCWQKRVVPSLPLASDDASPFSAKNNWVNVLLAWCYFSVVLVVLLLAVVGTPLPQIDDGRGIYTFWAFKGNCSAAGDTVDGQHLACPPTRSRLMVGGYFGVAAILCSAASLLVAFFLLLLVLDCCGRRRSREVYLRTTVARRGDSTLGNAVARSSGTPCGVFDGTLQSHTLNDAGGANRGSKSVPLTPSPSKRNPQWLVRELEAEKSVAFWLTLSAATISVVGLTVQLVSWTLVVSAVHSHSCGDVAAASRSTTLGAGFALCIASWVLHLCLATPAITYSAYRFSTYLRPRRSDGCCLP